MVHKPLYTLKGGYRPERKARDIYQQLFDQYQVDFVLHGHSHNMQRTLPIKYGGLDQSPIITDGLDFSQDRSIVSGAGGRMLYKFDEGKNRWTAIANDKSYGYHLFVVRGKQADIYMQNKMIAKFWSNLQLQSDGGHCQNKRHWPKGSLCPKGSSTKDFMMNALERLKIFLILQRTVTDGFHHL
jgi:hypothetical protein